MRLKVAAEFMAFWVGGGGDPEAFRSLAFMASLGLEVIPEDADSHGAGTW